MSQKQISAQTISQFEVITLETPDGEYQFVSHLLFSDRRDMKRTMKDCETLYHRIVASPCDAMIHYCIAIDAHKMSRHYKRHMLDVVRLIKDLSDESVSDTVEAK